MWQVVQHCHAFARSDDAEEHLRQGQITGHPMWGFLSSEDNQHVTVSIGIGGGRQVSHVTVSLGIGRGREVCVTCNGGRWDARGKGSVTCNGGRLGLAGEGRCHM